mmetsp:Transcript_11263/g.26097  ORF Transcript_11263/g.26097 Transcript_11263/m.26097 type:complete len:271 (+) Transcript_11263:34-846(+)
MKKECLLLLAAHFECKSPTAHTRHDERGRREGFVVSLVHAPPFSLNQFGLFGKEGLGVLVEFDIGPITCHDDTVDLFGIGNLGIETNPITSFDVNVMAIIDIQIGQDVLGIEPLEVLFDPDHSDIEPFENRHEEFTSQNFLGECDVGFPYFLREASQLYQHAYHEILHHFVRRCIGFQGEGRQILIVRFLPCRMLSIIKQIDGTFDGMSHHGETTCIIRGQEQLFHGIRHILDTHHIGQTGLKQSTIMTTTDPIVIVRLDIDVIGKVRIW